LLGPYLELGFCYRTVKQAGVESWAKFFEDHRRLVEVVQHGRVNEVTKIMTEHLARGRELSLKVANQN
jgi:DNA-binding FadR family transcriptional regulator